MPLRCLSSQVRAINPELNYSPKRGNADGAIRPQVIDMKTLRFVPIVTVALFSLAVVVVACCENGKKIVTYSVLNDMVVRSHITTSMTNAKGVTVINMAKNPQRFGAVFDFKVFAAQWKSFWVIEMIVRNQESVRDGFAVPMVVIEWLWQQIAIFQNPGANSNVRNIGWRAPVIFDLHLDFKNLGVLVVPYNPRVNVGHGYVSALDGFGGFLRPLHEVVSGTPQLARINHQSASENHKGESDARKQKRSAANDSSLVVVKGIGDLDADEGERFVIGALFLLGVFVFLAMLAVFYFWPEICYGASDTERAKNKSNNDHPPHD